VKNTAGTGASFAANLSDVRTNKKLKLSQLCSSFQAKMFAIYTSIAYISKRNSDRNTVTTISEESCVVALKDKNSTNLLVNKVYNEWYRSVELGLELGETGDRIA
jgi:hypothetical protein